MATGKTNERKVIWRVLQEIPNEIVWLTEEARLDVLIDLTDAERTKLVSFCSKIITTAMAGRRIKAEQLEREHGYKVHNQN